MPSFGSRDWRAHRKTLLAWHTPNERSKFDGAGNKPEIIQNATYMLC